MAATQPTRSFSLAVMGLAYLLALLIGWVVIAQFPQETPWWRMIYADLAATAVIFVFSVGSNNSSLYDPYWSLIPIPIVHYWTLYSGFETTPGVWLALILVWVWGIRLTSNFLRGWPGLHHEDWRYVNIRHATHKLYWPASLFGIHLFPTVIVFVGLYPVYLTASGAGPALEWVVYLGAALAAVAIGIEALADEQLRAFVQSKPEPGSYLASGLWGVVRHPNYLGEILFWWGLALMGYGSSQSLGCFVGAVSMLAMFVFVSVPMIDKRMVERRPSYAEHQTRTPALFPWKGIKPS